MTRVIETKKTPEQQAAETSAQDAKNDDLRTESIRARITPEQAKIAEEDAQYRKALDERGDLTLIPVKKVGGNATVKRVNDIVYPGDMALCERV